MFRGIRDDFDAVYWHTASIAVLVASGAGTAVGTGWLAYELLSRIAHFLLQWLMMLLFPPSIALTFVPNPVSQTVLIRAETRAIEAGVEVVEIDTDMDDGFDTPDPWDFADDDLPEAPPAPSDAADERLMERIGYADTEIEPKAMLISRLIGTTGESDAIMDALWAEDIGEIDEALGGGSMVATEASVDVESGPGGGGEAVGMIGVLANEDGGPPDGALDAIAVLDEPPMPDELTDVVDLVEVDVATRTAEPEAEGRGGSASLFGTPSAGESGFGGVPGGIEGGGVGGVPGGVEGGVVGGVRGGVVGGLPISGGGTFTPARLIQRGPIRYPEDMAASGIEATCRVELTVNRKGKVKAVRVLAGCPDGFIDAAHDAGTATRFEPARRDGETVEDVVSFTFRFQLAD